MANPLLLADFLTSSYETQNNASKILALHGLYVLMTQYNLEYPFFFGKLYSLLNINLFNAKYKARFFYLLDIFLQSSYVKFGNLTKENIYFI
jgi:U3 small nucleolar RNA-associated protein 19